MADGVLDAELAALVWLLIEGRVPLIVAGASDAAGDREDSAITAVDPRAMLLEALLVFLPPGVTPVPMALARREFDWLPFAPEAGWRQATTPGGALTTPGAAAFIASDSRRPVTPETTCLLIADGPADRPGAPWDGDARVAIQAIGNGFALGATIRGESLEAVFDALRRPPNRLTDDELTQLGVVLVLGPAHRGTRLDAAHYVRPLARDQHGHVQRMGPAVLATWDERTERFEHFAWGILPELAARLDCKAGDLEADQARRRDLLDDLVAAGMTDPNQVQSVVSGFRLTATPAPGVPGLPVRGLA